MKYFVYILQSLKTGNFYIGYTQDLQIRLQRHNSGKVRSTKNRAPWKIVYTEEFYFKQDAKVRELQIKSYKGGEAFKKLISNI